MGGRGDLYANVSARRDETHVGIRPSPRARFCACEPCAAFGALRGPHGLREVRRDHLHEPALALGERALAIQRDRADERFARDERSTQRMLRATPECARSPRSSDASELMITCRWPPPNRSHPRRDERPCRCNLPRRGTGRMAHRQAPAALVNDEPADRRGRHSSLMSPDASASTSPIDASPEARRARLTNARTSSDTPPGATTIDRRWRHWTPRPSV